jgi:Domain of unknown function (DUF6457)
MTADEWLESFAGELGVDPPTEEELSALLNLAGTAAHSSERIAAPIACWLVGRAGLTPDAAREIADRI